MLMLRFKVLLDQKFDKRMEQGLSSLGSIMNELEKIKIKRGTFPVKFLDKDATK